MAAMLDEIAIGVPGANASMRKGQASGAPVFSCRAEVAAGAGF